MREPTLISGVGSDRGTAYGMSNKIIRRDNDLLIGWLDAPAGNALPTQAMLGVCDGETGKLRQSMLLGEAYDNHCGPVLGIDGGGRVHAIVGSHGQGHRLGGGSFKYRWSDTPEDPASWSPAEPLGPADTYPTLVIDAQKTLHLAHRECGLTPEQRWELWYRRKRAGQPWELPRRLVVSPTVGYCNWSQSLALSPAGELHLVFQFHHGPTGRNVDCITVAIASLRSDDGGTTWVNERRTLGDEPAEMNELSLIRQDPQGHFRISNPLVDANGHPWFLATDPEVPTGILWRNAGRGWQAKALPPVELSPGVQGGFTWGSITYDDTGLAHLVMPARLDGAFARFFDPGLALYHVVLDQQGEQRSARQITPPGAGAANWLPSPEWWDWQRPKMSCAGGPWLLYTQGRNEGGIGGNNRNALLTNVYLKRLESPV